MSEWIEIQKQSWPTDQAILFCNDHSVFFRTDACFFQISGPSRAIAKLEFTHWMPIPEPPQ